MTMDYSPCPEREIWPFLNGSHISKTKEITPTKIGVLELDINPYLHEFIEPILVDQIFDDHGLYIVHALKGKFGRF